MKLLPESHSQSGQESFVLHTTDFKKRGTYVEVGAWHGVELSNTFLLETEYEWEGIAFDVVEEYAQRYNLARKNPCLLSDATTTDFEAVFSEHGLPRVIDYLQLDVEPAKNTYKCLMQIPFHKYSFRVITFEHDLYFSPENSVYKEKAFKYLTELGYLRIANNVKNQGNPYEDWYIHRNLTPKNLQGEMLSDVDFTQLFSE
jgi:hypothetical protein